MRSGPGLSHGGGEAGGIAARGGGLGGVAGASAAATAAGVVGTGGERVWVAVVRVCNALLATGGGAGGDIGLVARGGVDVDGRSAGGVRAAVGHEADASGA